MAGAEEQRGEGEPGGGDADAEAEGPADAVLHVDEDRVAGRVGGVQEREVAAEEPAALPPPPLPRLLAGELVRAQRRHVVPRAAVAGGQEAQRRVEDGGLRGVRRFARRRGGAPAAGVTLARRRE